LIESIHVSLAGAILALILLSSIVSLITWMLRLPEQTPATLQVARAIRLAEHANRILVPVQGKALSDRLVALGSQMARARQATIEVFYVIEVPWTLPLDAHLTDAEDLARQELERAQRIADRYGVRLETRVVNVRESGPAIVKEAAETNADIILMSDIPEPRGRTRFSQATTHVFAHAPCEVLLDRPAAATLSNGVLASA
jgi:nucleotide-binding universal stress UspA family protein